MTDAEGEMILNDRIMKIQSVIEKSFFRRNGNNVNYFGNRYMTSTAESATG